MTGRSEDRPELALSPIPLTVDLPVVPESRRRRSRAAVVRSRSATTSRPPGFPSTSGSLRGAESVPECPIGDDTATRGRPRSHLYVLLPVLDDQKHYWVSPDEIKSSSAEVRTGFGIIPSPSSSHADTFATSNASPARRWPGCLRRISPIPTSPSSSRDREEEQVEERIGLRDRRIAAVVEALRAAGARRVLDLGCGDGRLLQALLRDGSFERVVGVDVAFAALERAARRLHLHEMSPKQRERIELLQSSLTYRDRRLQGFDAAAVIEVIEHLEPARLGAFERVLFEVARPRLGRHDDAERRVQREVRAAAGWVSASPRPPVRMDAASEFHEWATETRRALWVRRSLPPRWVLRTRRLDRPPRWRIFRR